MTSEVPVEVSISNCFASTDFNLWCARLQCNPVSKFRATYDDQRKFLQHKVEHASCAEYLMAVKQAACSVME